MAFTDVFIKRPVFSTALSLIIFLVGLVSYKQLPVRDYPEIDASVVTVTTTYPGAPASLMEGFITTPMENAVSGIDGIDYMTSSSTQSTSTITVYMKLGYDIDRAMINISNKVDSVIWELPKDIYNPVIEKQDPNATPILWFSFASDSMSPEEITDYLLRVVQPQMETVNGVSQAQIVGEKEYSMRVWLDPKLMAAHQVTGNDIEEALNAHNVQATSGTLKGPYQQFDIYSTTDINQPPQFNNIVIRNENGRFVRIKDVGHAELGPQDTDFSVFMNGKPSIFMAITPKSDANPLDVVKDIHQLLPHIKVNMPQSLVLSTLYDASLFINASLHEVTMTIFIACFCVFLVIFFLLGSLRSVFVPVITIPLSLVGVCSLMIAANFSINMLTLLAFVLAIGLVVDDSVVVLENIHRHLESGASPKKAAIDGAREISFAVIAMTLTLAAVYAPIGFVTGLTGKLFREFAFTLAGTVLFSGFIALTLSPMMCSKLFKEDENLNAGFPGFVNRSFSILMNGYQKALHIVLNKKTWIVLIALVVYVSCYFLYQALPQELAPDEDQGVVMGMVTGPATANLDYIERTTKYTEGIFKTIPDVANYGVVNGYPSGVNTAFLLLTLKPWDQRKITAMQINQQLLPQLWTIPSVQAYSFLPASLPGSQGFTPVSFVLKTTEPFVNLEKYSNQLVQAAQNSGLMQNVMSDLMIDKSQVVVDINREKSADLGIGMSQIASALNIFLSTPIVTRFNREGRSYEVIPELYDQYRSIPESLNILHVRTSSGQLIPLSNIVNISLQTIPRSLNHFQQLRSATITANLSPGITVGQALEEMNALAKKIIGKDRNVQIDYSGQSRQFYQAAGKMVQTFIFAVIFIFLILAAQFESFKDPFIVMLSVPLSVAGALILLVLFGATINIYTQIGLVTLIGLITKNGILIVEFANQQQEKGIEFKEAIITAASYRLRPILMTTFAMILGALPLVFASGAGSVSRNQMGLVIVGGMSFGTLLTLFVVPTAYYLMATRIKHEEK
ncbi:MAG: efflux RND transporter permease subunit [Gammaproteobacteria bacterium]|nr:efflux RND transporter permease subunit [Gammaproteobacteria bacterium]